MTMTPLDLPGQLTLIRHTLSEFPAAAALVEPLVQQVIALGGINSLDALQFQKAQGNSVFGSGLGAPVATQEQLDALITLISTIALPIPIVPIGEPFPAPGWTAFDATDSTEPLLP